MGTWSGRYVVRLGERVRHRGLDRDGEHSEVGILTFKEGRMYCSATAIGRRTILTAAHCARAPTTAARRPLSSASTRTAYFCPRRICRASNSAP